ncbi:MAG TPA: sugar phosphate nucleotidyltransferase [Solirubrobacteraceae bacterium]|nr:sugar phosphate nucleotidyltransferase [Solirubrobacteraceae bacterium]
MKPSVVVLCGGRGTRLQERTGSIPKPMVEIGGRPIVWHVLQIFLAQGFRRFLLLTGYLGEQVERFVAGETWPPGAEIECLATGQDTPTGGRLHQAAGRLGGGSFCLTYADGVADIDLDELLAVHGRHGAPATMTVVRPRLPFGVADLDGDDVVHGFTEKPRSPAWVNGGFFCFEPGVLGLLGPGCVLEREPLERLAARGELRAFRHDGFWHCMDTYKDAVALNDLWEGERPPWKLWT